MRLILIAATLFATSLSPVMSAAQNPPEQKQVDNMTGPELLQCAGTGNCNLNEWQIADALRKRYTAKSLIALYPQQDDSARQVIVFALYANHSREVLALMRKIAFDGLTPGLTTENNHYYPLQYSAKRCDPDALRELNRPANFTDSYPVGCISWQETLAAFGRCRYTPAIAHLAMSLNSACLNNTDAAFKSLRQLLPHSSCSKEFDCKDSFQRMTDCYLREAQAPEDR